MEAYKYHTPVLLQETISYLLTKKNGLYVDGTLGGGGHAETLLERLDNLGRLIGLDLDDDARNAASKRLIKFSDRISIIKANFKDIKSVLSQYGVDKIHGVLLDLGVSSFQLDEPTKGFSFRTDEKLDMRMDREQQMDAKYVVNKYEEERLSEIFWKYGEEKQSRRIAKSILRSRTLHPIDTTGQLYDIVKNAVSGQFLNKTLARVFQAIRIEVNNEIENLRFALNDCIEILDTGGRIVVIAYHSLEDRLVKEAFRAASIRSIPSYNKIVPDIIVQPKLDVLTKKPITASKQEILTNPRSRSAKLRAAEKL